MGVTASRASLQPAIVGVAAIGIVILAITGCILDARDPLAAASGERKAMSAIMTPGQSAIPPGQSAAWQVAVDGDLDTRGVAPVVGLAALSSCLVLLAIAWRRAARNGDKLAARLRAQEVELDWLRLERTLAQRTAAQHAGELAELKAQFLTSLAHELRTPLNAIIGFSEILRDDTHSIDADTRHEYLGDILTGGRYLLALINDVIDLAKLDAGTLELHPQPLQLSAITSEVLAGLRALSTSQRIAVHTEIAPEVEALMLDRGRLKQVLSNYLSNAFSFTSGGSVTVRARGEGDRVRIEVEDTGVGISSEDVATLFDQTRVGPRRAGHTGLGLALTKRLVEAQGGEVGVRSTLGKGSVFHAILPRIAAPSPRAPTILVVEDHPVERERLAETLVKAGYTVETVATGGEALARCETRTYDAITLELLLPDMTGLEVVRRIRESHRGQVPVIVVTVVAELGAGFAIAVHDALAKPLAEDALRASLRRVGVDPRTGQAVVLVVDDDPASLEVMAASLTRLGYLAVCESDPVRGLQVATEEPPSAIVLDLVMPSMTGFEFLEQFRRMPAAREIPVILWTSTDRDELRRVRSATKGDGNARVVAELAAFLRAREEQMGA